jgi:SAM-dependent methyltransferase
MKITGKYRKFAAQDYRAYVGPRWAYDLKAAYQFMVACALGLREGHEFLEIGCGSLRAGRLFINYLLPGKYHGLESVREVVDQVIVEEIGAELINLKRATFTHNDRFDLSSFNQQFDMIFCHAVMIHLSRPDLELLFSSVKQYLKPDGVFIGNYQVGKDFKKLKATYPQITNYSQSTIRSLVKRVGLDYKPLTLADYRANTRWFLAFQPGSEEFTAPDSLSGMLNEFWGSYRK